MFRSFCLAFDRYLWFPAKVWGATLWLISEIVLVKMQKYQWMNILVNYFYTCNTVGGEIHACYWDTTGAASSVRLFPDHSHAIVIILYDYFCLVPSISHWCTRVCFTTLYHALEYNLSGTHHISASCLNWVYVQEGECEHVSSWKLVLMLLGQHWSATPCHQGNRRRPRTWQKETTLLMLKRERITCQNLG